LNKKPRLIEDLPSGPSCEDCQFRETSRGYTTPILNPDSLYVILGEASGYWEILDGVPFAKKSGGKLNELLDSPASKSPYATLYDVDRLGMKTAQLATDLESTKRTLEQRVQSLEQETNSIWRNVEKR
jgi:uracil-DNA glycosylase